MPKPTAVKPVAKTFLNIVAFSFEEPYKNFLGALESNMHLKQKFVLGEINIKQRRDL
jgi:hypothetical protein